MKARRHISRAMSCALAAIMLVALSACAAQDTRTVLTVWSWEPSMDAVIDGFEQANPDVHVQLRDTSGYDNLNSAIQDGYGMPDVIQVEYFALPQYAVSSQLLDITDRAQGYGDFYTPGTWSSVQLNGRVYGLPMDSGPMAFFYNQDVFEEAGVDASAIKTWDDYYQAAKKLKRIGVFITADAGDASFYNAMIWLAGGRPFSTSSDGKDVTVDLEGDRGTATFTEFWQKMIDEGLVNTKLTTWSDGWKEALGTGKVASVFAGAWMPSLLLADVPGASGLWRVAAMPTPDGTSETSENGGSALAILQSTRKPNAAYRFIEYVCHTQEGIAPRVAGGSFPADDATLSSEDFLNQTTVRDARGIDVSYFGGQQFNRVLAQAAQNVSVGYQYLPFEVYSRSNFRSTVGDAYRWQSAHQTVLSAKRRRAAGVVDSSGNPISVPQGPGKKITLRDGIAEWQNDLLLYGTNQGFTMHH